VSDRVIVLKGTGIAKPAYEGWRLLHGTRFDGGKGEGENGRRSTLGLPKSMGE